MTGEQLKMEGIERVSGNNKAWMVEALAVIGWLVRRHNEVTTDDLRHWVYPPSHPNAYGAAFNAAAKAGLIKRVGYRKSKSPKAHARVVSVWTKA